jgi:hypothetical protein
VFWGQGGTQTLALAQLLRTDLSHLLRRYGFSMVELTAPKTVQARDSANKSYELLDSMSDWNVKVLLEGVLLDEDGQPVDQPIPQASPDRTMKRVPPARPTGQQAHSQD